MEVGKCNYSRERFLDSIDFIGIKPDNYHRQETYKKQLFYHFTVSGRGAKGDINWWINSDNRISTQFVIDYRGKIYQLFSTKYFGRHLGVKQSVFKEKLSENDLVYYNNRIVNNFLLDKHSVGVELDTWGPLMSSKNKWYPVKKSRLKSKFVPNKNLNPIHESRIVFFDKPYKGFHAYEKFTDEQLESARWIAIYLNETYGIPLDYNEGMFNVNNRALKGEPGIWTHTSVRKDKFDCMPQPEFIEMLKSLK